MATNALFPLQVNMWNPPTTTPTNTKTSSGGSYSVQSGDTLSAIAARNGLTLAQLLDLNPQYKTNPNLINIGANINLGSGGKSGGTQTPSTTQTKTETVNGVPYNPAWAAYGVTKDVWASFNAAQQAQVSIAMNLNLSNYASNSSALSVADATAAAMKDPSIISKYADAFKIDSAQFTQGLADLNTAISTTSDTQAIQFEQDRKALAEASAAAGTAYSGFRGKAQENLGTYEAGLVTSSRTQAQQKLREAQQAFEAKWGTAATPTGTLNYKNPLAITTDITGRNISSTVGGSETLTGTNIGGITGSQNVAKSQDIASLAQENIKLAQPVSITPIQ